MTAARGLQCLVPLSRIRETKARKRFGVREPHACRATNSIGKGELLEPCSALISSAQASTAYNRLSERISSVLYVNEPCRPFSGLTASPAVLTAAPPCLVETLDSFLVDPQGRTVTIFQATLSHRHDTKPEGIISIAALCPDHDIHYALITDELTDFAKASFPPSVDELVKTKTRIYMSLDALFPNVANPGK